MTAKLDFIIGRSGTGKTHTCLKSMQQIMTKEPLGKALILLLPEHMTYKAERELAKSMPQGQGFFRGYVFGFRRFARQILLETGGLNVPRINDVGRQLLLRKILVRHQQAKDLTVFARALKKRGFTQILSDTIKELKSYELTPAVLKAAAERLNSSSRLAGKMNELAVLTDEFSQAMVGKNNDAEDMMQLLAAKIPEAELVRGAEVWLDGFIFFNPQEMRVLAAILMTAAKVHITLPMAGIKAGQTINLALPENQQETGIFSRSYRTMQNVCQLMNRITGNSSKWYPVMLLSANKRNQQESSLKYLEESLFSVNVTPSKNASQLHIVETANRRLEVETAAADILRLAREKKVRYRDIGVLIRDGEAYDDIVRLVFTEYGIPFFLDGKRQAIHHPLAELMRSAIEVVTHGWRYETVFRCLRTGFFPLVREDVDKLENYVLEFGIRGRKRWLQTEAWHWHQRYSLADEDEVSSDTEEKLKLIDGLRRQVISALAVFDEAMRKAENVQAMVMALYDFMLQIEVPLHLTEWTKEAEASGRLADASEHRQLWQNVIDLLDQLVEISGSEKISLSDFEAVLSDGLDALQIAMIPPGLDYVTVASFDQNSIANLRAIYVLGVNAGIMPKRISEQGLFTDADRLHIEEALQELDSDGKQYAAISHGSMERSFGEKFLLYRGFNEAKEYLWLSYALADNEGNGLEPSSYIKRLREIFPEVKFTSIPLEILGRQDDLQLAAARPALSGLVNALRSEKEQGKLEPFWHDVYNWLLNEASLKQPLRLAIAGLFAKANDEMLPKELAKAIYLRGKSLKGSVTQFEKFAQCPFAHFANFGLKLQERREYKFRNMDLGQLLHAVMKEYGELVKRDYAGLWSNIPREKQAVICHELVEKLAPRLQSEILLSRANYNHLKQRIERTALQSIKHLTAWAAISKFQPAYFEEAFGNSSDKVHLKPLPLADNCELSFRGQIDRLDVHAESPYYLIVDYKTGNAAINLFEVYYGLKLQLLVYLLVAKELLSEQGEKRLPAGMLYAFLQNPLIKTEKKLNADELQEKIDKELSMPGWVVADKKIIDDIAAGGAFIKVKFKKGSDDLTVNSQQYVKTPAEFELLLEYVACILQDVGNEILAGKISASPYRLKSANKNACTYCNFADVCGFDPDIPGYEYRDIDKDKMDEIAIEAAMAAKTGFTDKLNEEP
ncbi:MAG: helicase-exonuclease AddAB subunit AddB [Selenomonadales bacterium]|nr:helicase-exonuclease AddAB subunit AddB [Selenomonadales bacterium]